MTAGGMPLLEQICGDQGKPAPRHRISADRLQRKRRARRVTSAPRVAVHPVPAPGDRAAAAASSQVAGGGAAAKTGARLLLNAWHLRPPPADPNPLPLLELAQEIGTAAGRSAQYPRLSELQTLELEDLPRRAPAPALDLRLVDWSAERQALERISRSDAAVWLVAKVIGALLLARFALRLIEGRSQSAVGEWVDRLSAPLLGPFGSTGGEVVDFAPLYALFLWLCLAAIVGRAVRWALAGHS